MLSNPAADIVKVASLLDYRVDSVNGLACSIYCTVVRYSCREFAILSFEQFRVSSKVSDLVLKSKVRSCAIFGKEDLTWVFWRLDYLEDPYPLGEETGKGVGSWLKSKKGC